MSVGIGIKGREVAITVGGGVIIGSLSKDLAFNNEPLDTTDDQGGGWQERLATPGRKSISFSVNGLLKNLELLNTYFQASNAMAVSITYPEGSTLTFDAFMTEISHSGASDELTTFDASFESSGSPTWTPGV